MRARGLTLGLLVMLVGSAGCKRHKPPPRARIWLGPSHACATQKASGELECWGANGSGQLGDGTALGRTLPGPVSLSEKPLELALGGRHTCALLALGNVRCWGVAPIAPVTFGGAPLIGATAIAAGDDRTCVLAPDGVRCWADDTASAGEPPGMQGRATFLAASAQHECASFVAPKAVRCAGEDDRGQAAGRLPVLANATILGLAAGKKHTCAVLEDGTVQCWGANEAGQLGDGTTRDSRVPALVNGLPPAVEVRAGASFTCARLRNNTVACWGANDAYQLANGTTSASSRPAPITGIVGARELAIAGDSACARLTDGSVRCWGANDTAQLGDGTTSAHAVPMPVKAAPAK